MTSQGALASPGTTVSPAGSTRVGEALGIRTAGRYLAAGVVLEVAATALSTGRVTGMDRPVPAVASIGLVVAALLQAAGLIVLAGTFRGRLAARLARVGQVALAASVALVAVAFAVTGYGAVLLAEIWRGVSTADRPGPGGAYRLVESAEWDAARVGIGGVVVLAFALAVLAAGGPRWLGVAGAVAGVAVLGGTVIGGTVVAGDTTSGVLPDAVQALSWLWLAAAGVALWRPRVGFDADARRHDVPER